MRRSGATRRTMWSLLPFVLVVGGCADIDVRGVVRDQETQEPIQGATVRIGEAITTTDSAGVYEMDVDADEDPTRIHVSAPNYVAQTDMRPVRDDPDPLYLSFELMSLQTAQREQQKKAEQDGAQRDGAGSVPAGAPRIKVEATGPGSKVEVQDGETRAEAEVRGDKKQESNGGLFEDEEQDEND
mgnify:CR=1 FL=1